MTSDYCFAVRLSLWRVVIVDLHSVFQLRCLLPNTDYFSGRVKQWDRYVRVSVQTVLSIKNDMTFYLDIWLYGSFW